MELKEEGASDFVVERDIYGMNAEPWKIFKQNDPWEEEASSNGNGRKKNVYIFTKLNKFSTKRILRIAGDGTWEGQIKGEVIFLKKKNEKVAIGTKKMFSFVLKAKSKTKTVAETEEGDKDRTGHWNMYEYSLADSKIDDFVVCKVIRSKFKEEEEEEEEEEEFLRPCKRCKYQVAVEEIATPTVDVQEITANNAVEEFSTAFDVQEVAATTFDVQKVFATTVEFQEVGTSVQEVAAAGSEEFAAGIDVVEGTATLPADVPNTSFDCDLDLDYQLNEDILSMLMQSWATESTQEKLEDDTCILLHDFNS